MSINPNDEKYRRARQRSGPAIAVPENPPIFRRFCNFQDRGKSAEYAAEINISYWNYIRNSAKTGRNKDAIGRVVENKDKFLSHLFFTLETTGYGLLGCNKNPDYGKKESVLSELLEEEYGINMKPYVSEYVGRLKKEDEIERKMQEARKETVRDAIETRGELAEKTIFHMIDNEAAKLFVEESGITDFEIITGKNLRELNLEQKAAEMRNVLQKQVKKELGVSLPNYVQQYVDGIVNQSILDSYNCWLSQRSESNAQSPSQSVEFA